MSAIKKKYDLMWLTTAYGPYFGDIGLGLGLVKIAGNTAKAMPLCPAFIRLDPQKDQTLVEWDENSGNQAMGGVFPEIPADITLERKNRKWSAHMLETDYSYGKTNIKQQVVVSCKGVHCKLSSEKKFRLPLQGCSFNSCKVRRIPDGLHVIEIHPVYAPTEFTIKFSSKPDSVKCNGEELQLDDFKTYGQKAFWAFEWKKPTDNLEISVNIQRSFSPENEELAPLSDDKSSKISEANHKSFATHLSEQKKAWNSFFKNDVPEIDCPDKRINELNKYLAWVHHSNTIHNGGILPYPYSIPKQTFVGWWSWDTAKSAIAGAWYGNREISWGGLLNTENLHYPDNFKDGGVVPNSARFNGVDCWYSSKPESDRFPSMPYAIPEEHGSGTHPPMFSLAMWSLWSVDGNDILMKRLLDSAFKYDRYFENIRASKQIPGLLVVKRWSDSGMDNSKRWSNQNNRGLRGASKFDTDWEMPVISVDVNVYNITEKLCLAEMCRAAGMTAEANKLQKEAEKREKILHKELWNAKENSYFDRIEADGRFSPIVSPTNLSPLMLKNLPKKRIEPLLKWLFDEKHFWGDYPIPSIAKSDPDFQPSHGYWMGPVWMSYPIDILRGLNYHDTDAANKLLDKLLNLMLKDGIPAIYENYQPLTGVGIECPNFSWNGQIIDIIMRNMFGISFENGKVIATSSGVPDDWDNWSIKNLYLHGKHYDISANKKSGKWQYKIVCN